MAVLLIGIDDTRNPESLGTGKFARMVCAEIVRRGGRSLGVTRHQLLRDDRVPCKRHNRSACISVAWSGDTADLVSTIDTVGESAGTEADPGVCIARADAVPLNVVDFGASAMREVLTTSQAFEVAGDTGIVLRSLGRTRHSGQGIIGALASVGLRAKGNDGWFHDLPGVRRLTGSVSRTEIESLGITIEHLKPDDIVIPPTEAKSYQTLDWVRPRLKNGIAVWTVEWDKEQHEWFPVNRRGCWAME